MILAIDAQLQLLLGDASQEVARAQDEVHGKDRNVYELLGAAACLLGQAGLRVRHEPGPKERAAAWDLVRAAILVTENVEMDLGKLRTFRDLKPMFRLP